jgi:lipoyl(octanoyl) transferase
VTLAALAWHWLGRVGHGPAVAEQEARRDRILAGDDGAAAVLLCEHDPVVTLGRSADGGHVLAPAAELAARGVEVARASRGGDVTYHGPGQLMVYAVVRVAGVVPFLETVAGVLAGVAAELGVPGAGWRRDPAGLWIGARKLAACGLHLRRGVVVHGWAFNVATPPEMWRLIVPCGLASAPTSLADERAARGLPPPPPVAEVAARVGPGLVGVLSASYAGRRMAPRPPA